MMKCSWLAKEMVFLLMLGISAQAATTFWAGTAAGLLKSVDGGVTWAPVTVTTSNPLLHGNIQISAIALDPQQPGAIYFAGNGGGTGFYRSNDGGNTWTGITLIGIPISAGHTWIAIDPVLTNIIYLGSAGNLYKSMDYGTTWTQVSVPFGVGGLSVDPNASGTVYVSNGGKIYKSTDFGNTWTKLSPVATGYYTPSMGNVIVDPKNSSTLYVGDSYPFVNGSCGPTPTSEQDCGLFKSTDGGQSWTNVAPPGVYTQVAFDSQNGNLYVGGQVSGVGGAVVTSTDGGNTWNPVNNRIPQGMLVTDPGAANTLVAFEAFPAEGAVFRSTDAGVSWTQISLGFVSIGGENYGPSVNCIAVAKPLGNVSAASFESGSAAAESIVSALGFDLATTSLGATTEPPPTNLGGTTIIVVDSKGTSRPAPLFYVSPGQVNYEIPAGTAPGVAIITVESGDGVTSSGPLGIVAVAPSLFALDASGLAAAYALQILNGKQTYENVYQLGASNAIEPLPINLGIAGEQVYLLLYGTGVRGGNNFTATVGGVSVPVIFAGAQGYFVGEDQINVGPLPLSLAGSGNVPVVLTANGINANVVNVSIQ